MFAEIAETEFGFFETAARQLSTKIKDQDESYTFRNNTHNQIKNKIRNEQNERHQRIIGNLTARMAKNQLRATDLARMEGASSYLTTLPLMREFHDAIRMRYRWQLKYLPTSAYVE